MLHRAGFAVVRRRCAAAIIGALLSSVAAAPLDSAAASATRSCGQLHLRVTLVQDQTRHPGSVTSERLVVYHGFSCIVARRAVTRYFTVGPRPCEGSGCYGLAGRLWCGEDKAPGTALVCARSRRSSTIIAELLAEYG
jgi:hypothetical protein